MLRVGLVGYGFMGHMHADCYAASGDAKIAAVADIQDMKRDEAAAALGCPVFDSLDALLDSADVDIIDICLPTGLHGSHFETALARGKHVLCEKPLALTIEDCDRMIAAAQRSPGKVMVAHVIRFWPEYQVIKQLVDSGEIGAVEWVGARRLSPLPMWSWEGWIIDPARAGGAILDMAIHDVDYIAHLIGPPRQVSAVGAPDPARGVLSLGAGHPGGAKSSVQVTFGLPQEFPFTMSLLVVGERGTIRFDSSQSPSLVVYPSDGSSYAPDVPKPGAGRASAAGNVSDLGGYLNEINYFLDCVANDKQPDLVTLDEAREAVRICLASRQSTESGDPVSL